MRSVRVGAKNIEMEFDEKSLAIKEIMIHPMSACVCSGGCQKVMIRTAKAVSEPAVLNQMKQLQQSNGDVVIELTDKSGRYYAELECKASEEGIRFKIRAQAPEPIWLVEWQLSGLLLDRVIVPALGGQEAARLLVTGKQGGGGSQLGAHIGDTGALGHRELGHAGATVFEHPAHAPLDRQAAQQL